MRKITSIIFLTLLTNSIFSQEIINSLKKQAFDAADKQLYFLIDKVTKKDNSKSKDTTALTINETWNCSACGAKNNTGNFCKECGAKKPVPAEPWKCPKCGKEGNEGKFCIECGEKKPEKWICPNCGNGNTGNFCTECGTKKTADTLSSGKDYNKYILDLSPEKPENWKMELSLYKDDTPASTLLFSVYQDAINGILELPSAICIVTADSSASWKLHQQNVEAALSIMTGKYSNEIIELQTAQKNENTSAGPKIKISQEDKEEALKQASLDPAQVTEAHIFAALVPYLSKKWDIPEKDMDKIINMVQKDETSALSYVKEKYPEKLSSIMSDEILKKDRYATISDSLRQLSADIETHSGVTLEEELKLLVENISSSWLSSEEAQNVIELEEALDNMMSKIKNGDKTTPSFWTEARKAENSVIMSWNVQQAIKWRKVIEKHLSIYKDYANRLASYEKLLEEIRNGDSYDEQYIKTKTQCNSMISIIVKYVSMPALSLSIPLAKYVDETFKQQ